MSPRPHPRLSLSWRLCIPITVVVVTVMVAVSLPQRLARQRETEEMTRKWVGVMAGPLVQVLRREAAPEELEPVVEGFRSGVGRVLGSKPSVRIQTDSGSASYGEEVEGWSNTVTIGAGSTKAGASYRVLLDSGGLNDSRAWMDYWLHVFVTTLVLSGSLYGTLRFLVARPLERLLEGIRLIEMGYWGDVGATGGVWEIRWLSERFQEMGLQLERTVENLAAAERRGGIPRERSQGVADQDGAAYAALRTDPPSGDGAAIRSGLVLRLQKLQALDGECAEARELAHRMWLEDSSLAERLGEIDLKTRIEDAAFKVLDPTGFVGLEKRLRARAPDLVGDAQSAESAIRSVLARDEVPVLHVQYRIKGLGSVWRKMEQKGLLFSQIHDLLALRIVTRSAAECYRTLHLIHTEFAPIVGRFKDYIADPKSNGYRSIHTSVRLGSGTVCEIQIRSSDMHEMAEAGDCAHWRYRLDAPPARRPNEKQLRLVRRATVVPPRISRRRDLPHQ